MSKRSVRHVATNGSEPSLGNLRRGRRLQVSSTRKNAATFATVAGRFARRLRSLFSAILNLVNHLVSTLSVATNQKPQ